jgi:hypothetical protein
MAADLPAAAVSFPRCGSAAEIGPEQGPNRNRDRNRVTSVTAGMSISIDSDFDLDRPSLAFVDNRKRFYEMLTRV